MTYLEKLNQPDQPPFWPIVGAHLRFVVKDHDATQRHVDFRIELDGVMISWVLREVPSPNPFREQLAIPVNDHSLDNHLSERRIPAGQYGAGPLIVWDYGNYAPLNYEEGSHERTIRDALRHGCLDFRLEGHKLKGAWRLKRDGELWILSKLEDEHSSEIPPNWDDVSPLSGKRLEDL